MDIEERLRHIEVELFTITEYQRLGIHLSLKLLSRLMETNAVDANDIRNVISDSCDELKGFAAADDDFRSMKFLESYKVFLLTRLPQEEETKEFILTGGVS